MTNKKNKKKIEWSKFVCGLIVLYGIANGIVYNVAIFMDKMPGFSRGTFPHYPQVFPQGFSTVHLQRYYTVAVNISAYDGFQQNNHFCACRNFYHRGNSCAKLRS